MQDVIDGMLARLHAHEKKYVSAFVKSGRLDELGAGNYYLQRLERNALVPEPEWQVLRFILQHFPAGAHIVEIGCGWGQLLAMAAAAGYTCTGLDSHAGRLEGARFLANLVAADFVGAGDRLRYALADFPANWDQAFQPPVTPKVPTIGFFSNLGVGKSEEFCDACIEQLQHFDFVIMDIFRFFRDRVERPAQDSFIDKLGRSRVYFSGDIHASSGYRFVGLVVGAGGRIVLEHRKHASTEQPGLDLATTPMQAIRSTAEVTDESDVAAGVARVVRLTEDSTAASAHDLRLFYQGRMKPGRYELNATLRPRQRSAAYILLHCNWRDHARILIDAATGTSQIDGVLGSSFRVGQLNVGKLGDWTRVNAMVEVTAELDEVGISLHLANQGKQYYYDGDGRSALDIGTLRLTGAE